MTDNVTRDVIIDLWPVYRSGEASTATQRLVEDYLAADPALRTDLERSETMQAMPEVRLSPDAEYRMLADARDKTRMKYITIMVAIGAFCFIGLVSLVSALLYMGVF
jgi:hypothetical protein